MAKKVHVGAGYCDLSNPDNDNTEKILNMAYDTSLNTTLGRMWKKWPGLMVGIPLGVLVLGLTRLAQQKDIGPWFWLGLLGWAGMVLAQHGRWARVPAAKWIGTAITFVVAGYFGAAGLGWISW